MKPNDRFSFLKNNRVSQDTVSLVQCYLPIIGQEALSLYLYAFAFWDNGEKEHLFAAILNHLNMGMDRLLQALKVLSAVDLIALYKKETGYELELFSPLSHQEFLQHTVFQTLLKKKIGETAVWDLQPEGGSGEQLQVPLSQVFPQSGQDLPVEKQKPQDFDLEHFRQLMTREGLRFEDETEDVLALFALSQKQKMTWFELFQLAKETAVSHRLSIKRIEEKLAQKPTKTALEQKEQIIVSEAKRKTSLQFLAGIKKTRKGAITQNERDLLQQMAQLGLLDEVINIILLYTYNKVDSANINEKYAMKVANDFAYQQIHSAEEAVVRIRERSQKPKTQKSEKVLSKQGNIPQWSQPDYKNTTTEQEKADMERRAQELLAKLDKGGD